MADLGKRTSGLPHYNNSKAAVNKWEPAYLNQFEVIFTFPAVLQLGSTLGEDGNDQAIMTQQVKKISGLPEITPVGTVEQFYKFAKRTYAAAKPEDTTAELEIDFEVNLNANNDMYVYNNIRKWSNLVFDPMTGSQGLKKDYAGALSVIIFNKAGEVFRKFDFDPVYPIEPINTWEADYDSEEVYVLTCKFKADAWNETLIGL